MTRVLFVCMGNICRSPMAEGIFRKLLRERGLEGAFEVDSAGTGGWHAGEEADPRARRVMERHDASFAHRARQVNAKDADYDYIFVMDRENLATLCRMLPQAQSRIRLVMDLVGGGEVPDPYYDDLEAFEQVYAMLERAIAAFLDQVALTDTNASS
ncbi:low molecular weight protein-tyrosine-phosphatase [Calidithermus roseus]|uniref:protein-tyrosine-phosphatase n=1 Tax=Calidithermus roseus TaxID=1644118 RepID=A0A399ERK0_9DEIN|nr:low molecular weight protein-tyrosine-phosphatase [Calidithermus roseus]RIH86203.1 Low molecular weight protein-tyrosine-phosphatase YfkJ [Calidithermus roseus]